MRTASVSNLHTKTSELVRDAAAGEVIVIERRGKPVAELTNRGQATLKTPQKF